MVLKNLTVHNICLNIHFIPIHQSSYCQVFKFSSQIQILKSQDKDLVKFAGDMEDLELQDYFWNRPEHLHFVLIKYILEFWHFFKVKGPVSDQ